MAGIGVRRRPKPGGAATTEPLALPTDDPDQVSLLTQEQLHDPSMYLARYRAQLRKAELEDPVLPPPVTVRNINRVLAYRSLSRDKFQRAASRAEYIIRELELRSHQYDKWIKGHIEDHAIRKVVDGKNLGFLAALAWMLGLDVEKTLDAFVHGFSREGEIEHSMPFWRPENRRARREPKEESYQSFGTGLKRRSAPDWQGQELMDVATKKIWEQVADGQVTHVPHEQVSNRPAFVHVVRNEKKDRLVEDDSLRTKLSHASARMAMATPSTIMDAIGALMALPQPGALDPVLFCAQYANTKQAMQQIEHEVANKQCDYRGVDPVSFPRLPGTKPKLFFNNIDKVAPSSIDSLIARAVQIPDRPGSLVKWPRQHTHESTRFALGTALQWHDMTALRWDSEIAGAIIDLWNAYKQLPAKDPSKNVIAVYNRTKQIWETFLSSSILFGNGHSAPAFQSFSEMLASMMFLLVAAVVMPYIDDLTIIAFADDIRRLHHIMNALLAAAKIRVSVKPNGNYWGSTFLSLGIVYACSHQQVAVTVDPAALEKAVKAADAVIVAVIITVKLVEKMTGSALHVLMASRSAIALTPLRQLYVTVAGIIRSNDQLPCPIRIGRTDLAVPQHMVDGVRSMAKLVRDQIQRLKPFHITPSMTRVPATVYTDASMKSVGAIMFKEDKAYAVTMTCPPEDHPFAINLREAFAIYVAARTFQPLLEGTIATVHVDNVAALSYSKSRRIKNFNLAIVSACTQAVFQDANVMTAYKYIRTLANLGDAMTEGGHRLQASVVAEQFGLQCLSPVGVSISAILDAVGQGTGDIPSEVLGTQEQRDQVRDPWRVSA